MSCCGNKRQAWLQNLRPTPVEPEASTATVRSHLTFRYVGPGRFAVHGAATNHVYVFDGPGAKVLVAAEDARALMTLRYLRFEPDTSARP